jgi:hypothetical protein
VTGRMGRTGSLGRPVASWRAPRPRPSIDLQDPIEVNGIDGGSDGTPGAAGGEIVNATTSDDEKDVDAGMATAAGAARRPSTARSVANVAEPSITREKGRQQAAAGPRTPAPASPAARRAPGGRGQKEVKLTPEIK